MAGAFRYQHGDRPLDGYTILRGIGRGGFGEVYYAVSDGGREVALKLVQQNHDIELRGIRHCINLKSPYLVSIFDVRKNDRDEPFVIMEHVAGPSVREILRQHPGGLELGQAVRLLCEIVRGLAYLHDRGIVHRDLKPENIFYEDGYAKIGDYGLSKYISASRQSGQTISVGTVHYMAPEIGSGSYSQGIDIYALGIIFYELLTGRVPFEGDSMGEILMKHLTAECDVSSLPAPLRPVIQRALAKSPGERYQSATEMAEAALRDTQIAQAAEAVDPLTLSRRPGEVSAQLPAWPIEGASPPLADRGPSAGDAGPSKKQPQGPPRLPRPTQGPGSREHRLVTAIGTSMALSIFLSFVSFRGSPLSMVGNFALLGSSGAAIFWIHTWLSKRSGVQDPILLRLLTAGVAGPIACLAWLVMAETGGGVSTRNALPGILAGLLFVDWSERVRSDRLERISLGSAFSAGLFGFVMSIFLKSGMYPAWLLACLSVLLNVLSLYPHSRQRVSPRPPAPSPRSPLRPPPPPASPRAGREELAAQHVLPDSPTMPVPLPAAPRASLERDRPALPLRTKLVRPLQGRVLGGVASAFAATYGWDVVWVRLTFILATICTFFAGVVPYVVLWILMPPESRPAPVPSSQADSARRRGRWRRIAFCQALGVSIFVIALAQAVGAGSPANALDAWPTTVPVSILLLPMGLMAFFKAQDGVHALRRSSRPLAAQGFDLLGMACVALSMVPLTVDFLVQGREAHLPLEALPSPLGGWVGNVLQKAQSPLETAWIQSLSLQGGFFWGTMACLLAAMFCFIVARLWDGKAHTFRGLLGWSLAVMTFAGLRLIFTPGTLEPSFLRLGIIEEFITSGVLRTAALCGGAALSILLLAWPPFQTHQTRAQEAAPGEEASA